MKIEASVLAGRKELRQAMNACKGKILSKNCKQLSYNSTRKAFLQRHGSLNKYIFYITAIVPDRVHTHLRTHHLVNELYQCSTSRPDLTEDSGEERALDFYLPVKRLFEIVELRLCNQSFKDTIIFFKKLCKKLEELEPALKGLLQPSCVVHGYCREFKDCIDYQDRYKEYKSNFKKEA